VFLIICVCILIYVCVLIVCVLLSCHSIISSMKIWAFLWFKLIINYVYQPNSIYFTEMGMHLLKSQKKELLEQFLDQTPLKSSNPTRQKNFEKHAILAVLRTSTAVQNNCTGMLEFSTSISTRVLIRKSKSLEWPCWSHAEEPALAC